MRPKQSRDYQQSSLAFPKKDLWEKFPQSNRVRCCELIVQLLQAVVLAKPQDRRQNESED